MCLEILIKPRAGFYLTFVPNAKAVTDAPDSLEVLIKQRRRWNNGAMFGTYNVVKNFFTLLNFGRTTHNPLMKLCLIPFLIYYSFNFLLGLFAVGAMYISVVIFI
jgi:cellulose synthase/poly-beta-1,6-N-acetylglucosamine synthase-like glycosyltransferase